MTPITLFVTKLILLALHTCVGGQRDPPLHERASECGTRFTDPASRALLADIVLQGTIDSLRQASLLSPLLYKANVTVLKVYKGEGLLDPSDVVRVDVERFGPEENTDECIAKGSRGHTYLFFSKLNSAVPSSSSASSFSGRVTPPTASLINTALPLEMDLDVLRQVKHVLCVGCASRPVIKKLRCQNCVVKPAMMRKMSDYDDSKTVTEGKSLNLRCLARGSPRPTYTWFKDDVPLGTTSSVDNATVVNAGRLSIHSTSRQSLLVIKRMTPADGGTYRCLASNAAGDAEQRVRVNVQGGVRPSAGGTGTKQESTFDPCTANLCFNGGTCAVEGSRGTSCTCPPDFIGRRCQLPRRRVHPDEDKADGTGHGVSGGDGGSVEASVAGRQDQSNSGNNNIGNVSSTAAVDKGTSPFKDPVPSRKAASSSSSPPDPDYSTRTLTTTTASIATFAPDLGSERKIKKHKPYSVGSSGEEQGPEISGEAAKNTKVVVPQLKVSECLETDYCLNNGRCKLVVKLQRKFCECQVGFAGRRCEIRVS